MFSWAMYSALLRKKKFEFSQITLLQVIISAGLILLVPAYLIEMALGYTVNINLPFKNSYEALILASIIEKEGTEKKQIAGVFVRRLKLRMKLQSDPTIIFALGDEYDGDIKSSHIKMKHPYNTYYIQGLPPGPIGLVSESSIEAALNPEKGNSLFFVSKGDGTHYFSDTLEEHNQAVQRFQLNK
jgi:UPF0755 protein